MIIKIIAAIVFVVILIMVALFVGRIWEIMALDKETYEIRKMRHTKELLENQIQRNKELDLGLFFKNNQYSKIVVYGLGYYYDKFKEGLLEEQIGEIYLADGNAETLQSAYNQKVYSKTDLAMLDYDVIVVTSLAHYIEIREELKAMGISKRIVSYRDLVFNQPKEWSGI